MYFARILQMPKKIIGAAIIITSFQLAGLPSLVFAQAVPKEPRGIALSNGAVLTALEIELMEKNLVILPINTEPAEKTTDFTIAGMKDDGSEFIQTNDAQIIGQFLSWGVRTITAYNSEPGQTDDSPCTTANGFDVCQHGVEDTIAANFLSFGTKVRIPELFGDRVFVVRDRMNERYIDRLDVWMREVPEAKLFGVRRAEIEVLTE